MKSINQTILRWSLYSVSLFLCVSNKSLFAQSVSQKANSLKSNIDLNWDKSKPGPYSYSNAVKDFGSIIDWAPSRTDIIDGTFRVTLLPNLLSGYGGLVAKTLIEEGTVYELTYDVKFDKDFDFGKGGKVGFGLRVGDGNTGCDKANDGNGGSARLMWYTSDGTTKFKPYMYYFDMPENCGDNMVSNAFYPKEGSIEKGKWYNIKIYVKSNNANQKDGMIKVSIDGNIVLDQPIRWTANNAKRFINKLSNDTFRGGSGNDWKTDNTGYIYLDHLTLKKIE
ncbi:hypothetical protein A5893_04920 [Pedobacter psychrophilus]|uniref:Polysaccharide lyase 14 domain-containing protein n=1 Tax=Pedobacter psychrophilus TaxID=1826909 RepID=A0A179DH62_9SPHI|nr:hypothetical protein [Pedobacter psychrophilus]OAQ40298.1 hypothetical protein A5893_04920 [Pedobacter psychrophilus]